MDLSEKTKQNISKLIGIPYEQLIEMDDEKIIEHIEKRTGKKLHGLKMQDLMDTL